MGNTYASPSLYIKCVVISISMSKFSFIIKDGDVFLSE